MGRIVVHLALVVLATAATGAAQERPRYDIEGTLGDGRPVRGQIGVDRVGRDLVLEARLQGAGLPALLVVKGERTADGWRFKLPGTPGLRGAVARDGSGKEPRYLYLKKNADGSITGSGLAEDGTTPLGGLRGGPAAPPPPPVPNDKAPPLQCEAAPIKKVPLAVSTFARALWDFYKPGSDRFAELRKGITTDQTSALAQRLFANREQPFTTDAIYAEARAMTKSPDEALRLAFATVADQGAGRLPLAAIPGIGEDVPRYDKYEHFFASAILAERTAGNGTGSFTVGWLKEVLDGLPGGTGYDEDDLMADALGADFGQRLKCGEVEVPAVRRKPGR